MVLVASRGPVGGLQYALSPLVGFRANRPPVGSRLRRGSKQDRAFDLFRIARGGVLIGQSIEEVDVFVIGIEERDSVGWNAVFFADGGPTLRVQ
jgi:hypothetical protein